MRDIAQRVLKELGLDYLITMVSGGGSGICEVVMWDRPRNSYFSVRVRQTPEKSGDRLAEEIREQLRQRISSHKLSDDRRPSRRWSAA